MLFRPEKWSFQKSKNSKVFKGLLHGFCQKLELFTMCIFCANEATKDCFFNIVDRKECLLDKKVTFQKKSGKSKFSKGLSPWFLSKSRTCYHVCLLGKSSQRRSFFDILDLKKCSLDQKKWRFKKLKKNGTFPKRFVNGFCVKIQLFTMCVFWANQVSKDRFLIFWIEANAF